MEPVSPFSYLRLCQTPAGREHWGGEKWEQVAEEKKGERTSGMEGA